MRVIYAPRALRDLIEIGAYYRAYADDRIATAVGEYIDRAVGLVAQHPQIGTRVPDREGLRAVLLPRFPYRIFYRVRGDEIEIIHIRHTARRPWVGTQ